MKRKFLIESILRDVWDERKTRESKGLINEPKFLADEENKEGILYDINEAIKSLEALRTVINNYDPYDDVDGGITSTSNLIKTYSKWTKSHVHDIFETLKTHSLL